MSLFKRPLSHLKEPFGKAGLTVAICALVLAMVGGAYAAGGLTKSQEKQVTKIAKKYAGKPGATGPAGAAGAAGSAGPAGTPGKNGTPGKEGPEGSPWTDGGTLPSGSTETGTWGLSPTGPATTQTQQINIPISFPIPLASPLEESFEQFAECKTEPNDAGCVTHIFEGESLPTQCTGTVVNGRVTDLGAKPGNLCVYIAVSNPSPGGINGEEIKAADMFPINPEAAPIGFGAGRTGMDLSTAVQPAGVSAYGYWAVTAP